MSSRRNSPAPRDPEPLAAVTHGIDAAWHSVGGWLDDVVRVQQEALAYLHRRLERELDAVAHALACRDATELLDLQLCYAGQAYADGVALGLRLAAVLNGGARRRYRRAVQRRQGKAGGVS